jgi:hypothetical protein
MPSDCQCSTDVERVVVKMPEREARLKIAALEKKLRELQEENADLKRVLRNYLNKHSK